MELKKKSKLTPKHKIFILLPDGIGLRNFAFTNFYKIGKEKNFEIIYWNNTPFQLSELGFDELKIKKAKTHPLTDIFKNVRKKIELHLNVQKHNDTVYHSYRFPDSYKTIKGSIKNCAINTITAFYSTEKGLKKIRGYIKDNERTTQYYKESKKTLKQHRPAMVFCTNQRPALGIAPILAAQDLGIPTATFIFSWDNLPKATMILETDYYFVWSDSMKNELQFYYPYIDEKQIFVTGTPQFENHFNNSNLMSRAEFFNQYDLDLNLRYICYSGDDSTTCPDDAYYLEDLVLAVKQLNQKGFQLGIIFRRCPVDFSNRFDWVLEKYKNVIVALDPKWDRIGKEWNTMLPTAADLILQTNTIAHTEMVVNLGSSMVFDYVAHNKPCAFINYDVKNKTQKNWSVKKIYNYVHFRSMPSPKAVLWLNSPDEIASEIESALRDSRLTVCDAADWFKLINQHPAELASERIWKSIQAIIS